MKTLKAEELNRLIANGDDIPVINVLEAKDFNDRHIPNSINIPGTEADFVDRVQDQVADKSKPVIVYCASAECDASEKAAEKLEQAGFADVRDFADGTEGWENAGFQLAGRAADKAY